MPLKRVSRVSSGKKVEKKQIKTSAKGEKTDIEAIWSKIKSHVKRNLRIPQVEPPGVAEQRLVYLEEIIDRAKNTIVGGDCARAAQHSTVFHSAALSEENMPVRT